MNRVQPIQVVDLFAGPGGLGEGFSSYDNGQGFEIVVSAEKDAVAHRTLRLRAFFRLLKQKNPAALSDYYAYCNGLASEPWSARSEHEWKEAGEEARCITLGSEQGNDELDSILHRRLDTERPWVLIGGPPCQAYSIVGRARNRGNTSYRPEDDHRHFLYREYLRIIQRYRPAVFVMENVKGILSSRVGGKAIFPEILQDLANPDVALGFADAGRHYRICSLVTDETFTADSDPATIDASGFVIRAELHGIPQARHRVILLGIAEDEQGMIPEHGKLDLRAEVTVGSVLENLPPLRSSLSRGRDSLESWYVETCNQLDLLYRELQERPFKGCSDRKPLLALELQQIRQYMSNKAPDDIGELRYRRYEGEGRTGDQELDRWYLDKNLRVWLNHEARSHMPSDLRRYVYAAAFAKVAGHSPKGHLEFDLPSLAPEHRNWETGKFSDRFRVQLRNAPSSTITSHISKDGHYFIHYNPLQCRSLTVREAARLQTFPDNYFFEGNRTQQFHQVGNAVPPLLAAKIAAIVAGVVEKKHWSVAVAVAVADAVAADRLEVLDA